MHALSGLNAQRHGRLPALLVLSLSLAARVGATEVVAQQRTGAPHDTRTDAEVAAAPDVGAAVLGQNGTRLAWVVFGTGGALSLLLAGIALYQVRRRNQLEQASVQLQHRVAAVQELNKDLDRRMSECTSELLQVNARLEKQAAEREALEENLRTALAKEKELSELKGNFISMVSHEIRTPLALILSSSEILSRYFDRLPAEKRQRHLQNINQSVHRMSALMEDVLLFSRAEAGRMEFRPAPFNLAQFCRQFLEEIASATAHRCPLEFQSAGLEDTSRGDESLLRHILGNLLTNAIKYSATGSPVTLRARREEGLAVLEVADRGIGISEADQARLFTPFHRGANTGAATGTGLGLVIVRRCVERHGGQMHVESQLGVGTTVTVQLPMFSPAHTQFLSRFN